MNTCDLKVRDLSQLPRLVSSPAPWPAPRSVLLYSVLSWYCSSRRGSGWGTWLPGTALPLYQTCPTQFSQLWQLPPGGTDQARQEEVEGGGDEGGLQTAAPAPAARTHCWETENIPAVTKLFCFVLRCAALC